MEKPVMTEDMQRDLIEDAKDIAAYGYEQGFQQAIFILDELAKNGPDSTKAAAKTFADSLKSVQYDLVKKARDNFNFTMDDFGDMRCSPFVGQNNVGY